MPRNLPESLIVSDFEQSRFRVGGIKPTTDNCFVAIIEATCSHVSTEERIREVGAATTSESHNWFGASHQSKQLAFTRQNTQKNKLEVHVLLRTISDDQTAIKRPHTGGRQTKHLNLCCKG